MVLLDPERTGRLLAGRTNRRRFLAGVVAAGLASGATVAPAATGSIMAQVKGGAIMARQSDGVVVTNTLPVPGARLYYEVAGSGPVLLLIPGGAADADIFAPIVGLLADNYTVVRYDPPVPHRFAKVPPPLGR